ncbi:hypothetical protein DIJ64_01405 [Mycobacterium leprae]|uniref:Uncharacterized protein n=1 Tax=Mycobacterium leprae TaxID=1769 RepID=A0AAD0P756_MYCLR|nr:hypothetical protein DIJ64_01405 [Mycobacterium leprae]OAR21382.1 hypothetical protein A8144_06155 [Mycobacterium leprae 3125609]OAX71581.1 hypothetical protein A3216_04605 [Mycobacterium leprae 7935681]
MASSKSATTAWCVGTTIPTTVPLEHTLGTVAPAVVASDVVGASGATTAGKAALANMAVPTSLGNAPLVGPGLGDHSN